MAALRRSVTTGCAGPAGAVTAAGAAPAGTGAPSSSTAGAAPSESGPSASLSAVHASRPPRGGRAHTPSPPAPRIVDQAETGSSMAGILVPALLALLSALALLALPEVRRRLHPATAGPATSAGAAPARQPSTPAPTQAVPMAAAASAPPRPAGTASPDRATLPSPTARAAQDASLDDMVANILGAMAPAAKATPRRAPETDGRDPHAEVEHEVTPPRPRPGRGAPRPRPGRGQLPAWARERATRAALVATVLLGGLVRMLRRGRRRRRRRG